MKIDENLYIGKRFGNMTILRFYGRYRNGECVFVCKCDCGAEFHAKMVEKGKIRKSCLQCYIREFSKTSPRKPRIFFEINGSKYSIKEISEKVGITKTGVRYRIKKWEKSRLLDPKKQI